MSNVTKYPTETFTVDFRTQTKTKDIKDDQEPIPQIKGITNY